MRLTYDITQRLRLISGLTMFVFVTTHLLNHALGLVSLDAMQAVQRVFLAVWVSGPGATLLLTALLTHLALVSWKQVRRRTWRMPVVEAVRIALGITVLFLLIAHVLGNYVLFRIPGASESYAAFLRIFTPEKMLRQALLVIAAWGHGCIGVHRWLRLRHGYRRLLPVLYPAAVLLPVLAWLVGRSDAVIAALVAALFALAAFSLPLLAARSTVAAGTRLTAATAALRVTALDALTGLREVRAFGA